MTDNDQPQCSRDPAAWDVDMSTVEELRRSARLCVYRCPLYRACKNIVESGSVKPRAMVWAGRAYDDSGDVVDLDRPGHKVGRRSDRDTRIADGAGRVYDGHTGHWEPPQQRYSSRFVSEQP